MRMYRIYKVHLIIIALMSFISTPNAFINPTWATFMWAITLQVLWWNYSEQKEYRELNESDNLQNKSKKHLVKMILQMKEESEMLLKLNTIMFNDLIKTNMPKAIELMNERVAKKRKEMNIEVAPQ